MQCRQRLERSSVAWLAGDRHGTWAALADAAELAGEDPGLRAEVEAWRSVAFVRAERQDDAEESALRALSLAEEAASAGHRADDPARRRALAHARVSLASARGLRGGSLDHVVEQAAELERLAAADVPGFEDVRSRALSNWLVLRQEVAPPEPQDCAAVVDAWTTVSRACTLARDLAVQGTVIRQAVDLGFRTGHWALGWDYARLPEAAQLPKDEQVALWSKAAMLAWERGWDDEARELGRQASRATTAVSIPWVRLYGYQGAVVAAAAGGGSIPAALVSYAQCVTPQEHATRPHRAMDTALVALESGCSPEHIRGFFRQALPDRADDARGSSGYGGVLAAVLEAALRVAEGRDPELVGVDVVPSEGWYAATLGRLGLLRARALGRQDRHTAALQELDAARRLLRSWPGRVRDAVEQEIRTMARPPRATPAQAAVLALLVEGWPNRRIADQLGLSDRTVAVHVAALLRSSGAASRTELVVHEMVRRFARQ
ncbi:MULTISPECIES: helix-turn-helix transcriptional regulator [Actinomycetes]|uniref:HTH luxR-type domain-containing protein n=2 Tax=Actinomycetes TaxID=1760 RepID=A0ABP6LY10_9MICC